MGFKLNNAPFKKKLSATHTHPHPTKDEKTVAKGEGTKSQDTGNLLDVLSETKLDGSTNASSQDFGERQGTRNYYEKKVLERDPGTSSYRGDAVKQPDGSKKYVSQMDMGVDFETRADEQAASEKAAGNWHDTSRVTSGEGSAEEAAAKGGSKAVNRSVTEEAQKRTKKNKAGAEAQTRIDTAAEEDKVSNMSNKERREHERANSALPKSGFKMQRKGYKH